FQGFTGEVKQCLAHNGVVVGFELVSVFEDKYRSWRVVWLFFSRGIAGRRGRLLIGLPGGCIVGSISGLPLLAGIKVMAAIAGISLLIRNCIMSTLIIGLPKRLRIRRRSGRIRFRGWLYVLIRRWRSRIGRIVIHGI